MKISEVSAISLLIILASGLICAITYPVPRSDSKNVPVGLRIKPAALTAIVDVEPNALNLISKGKWITTYIELPEGYNVSDIDASLILLNATISAEPKPIAVGDYNEDTVPDLMVKFDRAQVISYIVANVNMTQLTEERFMTISLTITGELYDETPFQGSDTIKIILPKPNSAEIYYPI